MKRLFVLALLLLNLYPAFGDYVSPTNREQELYDNLIDEFEKLSISRKDVSDTLRSFDEPIVIPFPCDTKDVNKFVNATITTRLAKFDDSLASHEGAITGGIYVWKCSVTYSGGNLSINCQNELMLNSDAIQSTTDKDPQVKQVEDLVILYHELLHGQLMIDAMRSSDSWHHDTCNKRFHEQLDYSYTDGSHQVITPLQTEFASQLIKNIGGILQVEEISPEESNNGEFTKNVGSLFDYPQYVKSGISISARSYNIADVQIYSQKNDIMVSGHLSNNSQPGIIWLYVFDRDPVTSEPVVQAVNQPAQSTETEIPAWIKNNAKWWADGTIGDNDFVLGIQYLVNYNIIKIPQTTTDVAQNNVQIPAWIKNNAKWWADGTIKDSDFVQGIQYLIKMGIMRVQVKPLEQTAHLATQSDSDNVGTLNVSDDLVQKQAHQMTQITITGTVSDFQAGTYITLTIVNPDRSSFELKGILTKKGEFSVPYVIYDGSQIGSYLVTAKYNNLEFGHENFSVQ